MWAIWGGGGEARWGTVRGREALTRHAHSGAPDE